MKPIIHLTTNKCYNIGLFILLFTASAFTSFANLQQGAWRWRVDDGSETTATWLADENTAPAISSMSNIRLRLELYNNDVDPAVEFDNNILQDSVAGVPGWFDVTGASTSNDWMLAGSSAYISDLEATTNQLNGASANPFQPGLVFIITDIYSYTLPIDTKTEFEWVLKPNASLKPNTAYYFRLSGVVDYPNGFASLITDAILPVNLISFNVSTEDKRVKLMWTTASEQNNDRFEVLRSANGKDNWQVVATQKGSGTTAQSHTYTAYDEHPFNGKNYYQLKQFDQDGKFTVSDIRLATMQLIKAVLNVFPNPTRSTINFSLSNYSGSKVLTVLTDIKGNVIHREVIQTSQAVDTYILNLKALPVAGTYFIQITGNGFLESRKIIVQ